MRGHAVLVSALAPAMLIPGLRLTVEVDCAATSDWTRRDGAVSVSMHYLPGVDSYDVTACIVDREDNGVVEVRIQDCVLWVEPGPGLELAPSDWVRFRAHGLSLWDAAL